MHLATMKLFVTLTLFCVALKSALAAVDFVNVHIKKSVNRNEHFIRLDNNQSAFNNNDWIAITGENTRNGEISFFRGLRSSNGGKSNVDIADNVIEDYSFEKLLYVCNNIWIPGQGRVPGSLLSKNRCPDIRDQFEFYVAEADNPHVERIYYVTCTQMVSLRDNNHARLFYSRISKSLISCFKGDDIIESGLFYALEPKTRCPNVKIPTNGHVVEYRSTTGGIPSAVVYGCDTEYEIRGKISRKCDSNGSWKGRLPTCSRFCPQPPIIAHAQVNTRRKYFVSNSARYTCDTGYELENEQRIRCDEDGTWSDPGVVCKRVSCDFPGMVTNGDVVGSKYEFGDSVRFTCDSGYLRIGAKRAECLASGKWSDGTPECQKILCPFITFPENGMRTETDRGVGSEVIYSCHEGYTRQGPHTLTCEEQGDGTGAWSHVPSTCSIITCAALEAPDHGTIRGEDFTYDQRVSFTCNTGYTLRGSQVVTCGLYGWDSPVPRCQIVQCRPPRIQENVVIDSETQQTYVYDNVMRFACKEGYTLEGSSNIRCQDNGRWSSQVPTCEAVHCPPLPAPLNGARDATDFTFGNKVLFSCFPGYAPHGDVETTCQSDGSWNNLVPSCRACPRGFFKDTVNNEACVACPPNSMTSSEASTSIVHCQCNTGSSAAGGDGLCEVIECQQLTAPENGVISECGIDAGAECHISCNPGFLLEGSGVRRCRADGWSGVHTRCLPCPTSTYKEGISSSTSCFPCPRHSITEPGSPAGSPEECFCKPGYHNPSGEGCEDINECATNNGDCGQTCTNVEGDHLCSCSIPGHKLDEDGTTCIIEKSCPKLESSPGEGHLSCFLTPKYNSAICHIKCNPGYDFVSGVNNYVTCGPDSQYEWSHRRVNKTARIPTCTKEFFVDTKIQMSFKYQTGVHCNTMPILQSEVQEQVQDVIEGLSVCRKQCVIVDMNTTCSEFDGQGRFQSELELKFEVLVKNPEENAVSPQCNITCKRRNLREMLRETFNVKMELLKLVQTSSPSLQLPDLPHTELIVSSFEFGKPQMLCEGGKVFTSTRMCVPCDAGFHLPSRDLETCIPCEQGTYQDKKGQVSCRPCLPGSTTLTEASDHPTMCNQKVLPVVGGMAKGVSHLGEATNVTVSEEEVDDILMVI